MNTPTVMIGVFAVTFGAITIVLRHAKPQIFKKLEPMKERFGERRGYAFHFIGYSVVPILFGVSMVITGLNGGSLFDQ